jgi:hypothetical protein
VGAESCQVREDAGAIIYTTALIGRLTKRPIIEPARMGPDRISGLFAKAMLENGAMRAGSITMITMVLIRQVANMVCK